MIFKRRFSASLLVLLCSTFVAAKRGSDFKFDADDLQVVYSDPPETVVATPSRYFYTKEIAQCPPGESKMMLTLLLQSLRWGDIGEKKREKAIRKMSRFFLVPVKYITLDDIHTTEMLEMLKHSINKSNNLLNTKEKVGRMEFMIGCGDKLFASSKSVAHKVNDYVKSGKLEEMSGLPIHWWNIWAKHVKSRVQRTRRDTALEGSGNPEYYDEDEEGEYTDTNDEDGEDEDPIGNGDNESPQQSSVAAANARQNTNQRKRQQSHARKQSPAEEELSKAQRKILADPPSATASEDNNEESTDSDYQIPPDEPLAPIDAGDNGDDSIREAETPEEEEATQRASVMDGEVNSPTPIGTNEIMKLEKEVDKTIENANNVDDVPLPPKQQDDKILEEFVNSMISSAPLPPELTTTEGEVATTSEAPPRRHHQHHHHSAHETVTSASDEMEIHAETPLTTAGADAEMINESFTTTPSTTTAASVHAPEAETIFTPINNGTHNERMNVLIDEKLPIVTAPVTLDPTTTTLSSAANMGSEKESIMIEENVTDEWVPSLPVSSPSPSSSSPLIINSSTSHEHETTYPFTTNPTIITTTTAEITTIITSIATESLPITEPSTTTTLRIVDATVAHVAEDKVTPSTETAVEERISNEESNYDDEYDDDDDNNLVEPSQRPTNVATTASAPTTIKEDKRTPLPLIPTAPGEDDDEDEDEEEPDESVLLGLPSTTTLPPLTTQFVFTTTTTTTTSAPEVSSEASSEVTSDISDYNEEENQPPTVVKRIKKIQATSGKTFSYKFEEAIFDDDEDVKQLRLELLDKLNQSLPASSWIRFDAKNQEIYGLPLENDVSRHEFKLRATDSGGESVDESVDVTVQQHKSFRSVNHEIFIQVTLDKHYDADVDWKIRLIRGIVEALDDDSIGSIIVRDVTQNKYEPRQFTFSYTNDSLPKDHCPKEELEHLMTRLTKKALNDVMRREIVVRNVQKELINSCAEVKVPLPPPSQPNNKQNFPPTVRNQVDRVVATIGQLLVFAVPKDTFYDPEDQNDLKLSLVNENRSPLDPANWLQFDAKNNEFYGVPTFSDKTQTYVLVAEDKSGLSTNDALVVEVNNLHSKRDYSATFEYQLEIGYDQFQNAATKRKFIERIQQFFGNADTSAILIKSIKKVQYSGRTAVVVQNTTLHHRVCPEDEITKLRNRLVRTDGSLRDDVKQAIGSEFNVQKISIIPVGKCLASGGYHHLDETSPVERPEEKDKPLINEEVLITYVLPSAIILLMLLIALLIACLLYKRRNTGKMELGDEEERKSFRSKGIPVIFQDELDEKPEIVTKSPVILKDEKPPLLPQYNGLSQDGDEDVDQYIPPQPLLMGSRDSRGKSPVSQNTPSYRKPPPYVSP